jgi:trehalose/maltose hydrolase-like predicted phosphorylase
MFPWESAFTGEEVCPTSAPTGQLEQVTFSRNSLLINQHISGDIAFALWQYWSVTQNVTWLNTYGWPLFQGISGVFPSLFPRNCRILG